MNPIKFRCYILKRTGDDPSILRGGFLKLDPASDEYVKLLAKELARYDGRELECTFVDHQSWTSRMNRLFHALIHKVQRSGQASFWDKIDRAPQTFAEIKTWVKVELGDAHVERVGEMTWVESWTNFNKRRALQLIDNLINWMLEVGIDVDAEKLESESLRRK